ncbi:MAG: hypothetical protein C0392_07390 [Syntrophus sp. (in: bacteria)]|nr:hypothetical protein [Syntrophus sp. (in: bacteria)]
MANGTAVPEEIYDNEILARFVVFNRWIRSDNTVRSDAFIPYSLTELSVTRHIGLSLEQLWAIGRNVVVERALLLHGRADINVSIVKGQELSVHPASLAENPNHANIKGWPPSKSEQKIKALEIAKTAIFSRHIICGGICAFYLLEIAVSYVNIL